MRMELGQLLNAIIEVSQAVAKMPCAPQEKNEVLDKIKDLFSSYTAISNVLASAARSSEQKNATAKPEREQTGLKQCSAASEGNSHIAEMLEKIQNMDEKLCLMEQKLDRVERQQEHKGAGESLSSLRSELAEQAVTVRAISEAQGGIYNRVAQIENKSNDLELLQNRIQEISVLVEGQLCGKKLLEELIEKNAQDSKEITAFSAFADKTVQYKTSNVILFKNVDINFNDCFDPHNSTFRTKLLGLYAFSTSVSTNSDGDFEAAIVRNNVEVALFGTSGNKDLQTGTFTILWLSPGDTVYVRVRRSNPHDGIEIGSGFSNFIGYKIA